MPTETAGARYCDDCCELPCDPGAFVCPACQTRRDSLTRAQIVALKLLGRGGARYGTRINEMKALEKIGLAYAHDTGKPERGQWVWRPTDAAKTILRAMNKTS